MTINEMIEMKEFARGLGYTIRKILLIGSVLIGF